MTFFELILISIALAMDCFTVSIASSVVYGRYNWVKILRMALCFGLFQGVMPLISWSIGEHFVDVIKHIDHWIAFAILGYFGVNMIYESFKKDRNEYCHKNPYGSLKNLLLLSVATSIDALAMGIVFVPFDNLIFSAALIIGIGSFIFTVAGCVIGISAGNKFNINVEMVGGVILILIGLKILIEHLINHGTLAFI